MTEAMIRKKPGMASVKDMPLLQDGPPPGPSAMAISLVFRKRNTLRVELFSILQAEEDERFVSEWKKYLDYEADVMKDVPGWKVGENVYNSGRWMPPATGELRPDVW
ncbi:hypothetical protein F2Q70_00008289 [Brassica cretica]|uniref:NADH dehydrogenase [ubiquinone] 1 alpha subcomplex subunit 13 n=1 Tax=Brassica cretica TaxID=69181 RepID=A0A8S9MBY4_BRACR|nr:hypothetical protein F2Q70_00008289 [Brassica cretica]KAF3550146.1 hypothetical protein DY000_02001760 [Brassica cretica]